MKIAKFLCSFLVAFCACLCVTPALAESKTVTLNYNMQTVTDAQHSVQDPIKQPIGGTGVSTVTLNENGTVNGSLPTPTTITGWTFIGWYDKPVHTMWWNAAGGKLPWEDGYTAAWNNGAVPSTFSTYTNLRGSGFSADNDFFNRLVAVENGGRKVDNSTDLRETTNLYAAYTPQQFEVYWYANGFEGYNGAMRSYHDYYTFTKNGDPYLTKTYILDGWYKVGADGKGTDQKFNEATDPITSNLKLYAKWHKGAEHSPEFFEYGHSTPVSISIGVGSTPRIDPKKGNITVSVSLQSAPGDPNPNRADYSKVQWSCEPSNLVKIAPNSDHTTCTITTLGNPGTVTIKATYDGKLTATQEITLAHSFSGNAKVEVYPSCEGKGKGYRLCSVCGAREEITWAADGHRFTYHRENATCTKPGCVDRYCVVCGKHEHETTQPALNHNYASKQIRSCTGLTTIETCSRCGNQITTTDSSAGSHHWASTKTVDKAATCKTEGTKSLHCLDCDVTTQQETIPILTTHTLGSYVKVKDATANEKGLEEATCSVCGLKESRDIPKLEDKGIVTATPDSGSSTTPTTPGGSTGGSTTTTPSGGGGGSSSVPSLTPDTHEQIPPITDDQEQVTPPEDNVTPPEDNSNNDDTTTTPPAGNDNDNTPVPGTLYRLYNKSNGAHLLTKDLNEKNTLVKLGWKYEGTAGVTSDKGIPVYRLYNPSLDEHMFTSDVNEYNTLGRIGWKQEGEAWKADGTKPMYRLYNPNVTNGPNHHYTTDVNEYNVLGKIGWNQEGIAWYLQ